MTTKHFSEADLLETYYLQPGQSMPVMMHLASCTECAARYERLERKLREAAVCTTKAPETFWTRQRLSIARRIRGTRPEALHAGRSFRIAAAALLAFFLGGAVVYETVLPQLVSAPAVVAAPASATAAASVGKTSAPASALDPASDPWQSDELRDFRAVVQWESWVPEAKPQGASS